jgi:hypothetical protein
MITIEWSGCRYVRWGGVDNLVSIREVNCSFETVVSGLQTTVLVASRKPNCRCNGKQEANPSSLCVEFENPVKRRKLSGCDALLCFGLICCASRSLRCACA